MFSQKFQASPKRVPAFWVDPYHPDRPPASPTSMDDEFNGKTLDGKWTIWNPSSTAITTTLQNGCMFMDVPYTLQAPNYAIFQPAPQVAWRFRMKSQFEGAFGNFFAGGFVVRNSSNGKSLEFLQMAHSSYGVLTNWLGRFTNTTFNTEVDVFDQCSFTMYNELAFDGVNFTWSTSMTGKQLSFRRSLVEALATHLTTAPDQVGIGLYPWNAATGNANWGGRFACDWFRRIKDVP